MQTASDHLPLASVRVPHRPYAGLRPACECPQRDSAFGSSDLRISRAEPSARDSVAV
jgi:hypothetical protein